MNRAPTFLFGGDSADLSCFMVVTLGIRGVASADWALGAGRVLRFFCDAT
jgi:hypothetical protein